MLLKIGTIGSTQGVNDNNNPNSKNSGTIATRLPLFSALSTRAASFFG
jgi:hypothetical protein